MKEFKFASRLKEIRKEKDVTQKQLAEICFVKEATVSRW